MDFNVVHKSSKDNSNADYLSRIGMCTVNSGGVKAVSSTLAASEFDEFDNSVNYSTYSSGN